MTIAFIKLIPMLHRLHSASHYKVKRNKVVIEEIDIIDITIEVSLLDFIVWLFFISAALLDWTRGPVGRVALELICLASLFSAQKALFAQAAADSSSPFLCIHGKQAA